MFPSDPSSGPTREPSRPPVDARRAVVVPLDDERRRRARRLRQLRFPKETAAPATEHPTAEPAPPSGPRLGA